MARFTETISFDGDKAEMVAKIRKVLEENNYKPITYKDEDNVYKQGTGIMTAAKYFKYTITDNGFIIEAFVILFGIEESGITGFTGMLAKKPLKKMTDKIIDMIKAG